MRKRWWIGAISLTCGVFGCTRPMPPAAASKPPMTVEAKESKPLPPPTLSESMTELEKFIARQDVSAPMRANALFRLAALKEDQARHSPEPSQALNLDPSIEMYRTLIRDYADQPFIPSIHYFLGHALVDSGRAEEGQQAFRTLVCRNHFAYAPAADSKTPVTAARLPQDHEAAFWTAWESRHPRPRSRSAKSAPNDEMVFVNPYPADCVAMEPKFLGEVWWRIGDYHFEQTDSFGGPYNLNRAAVAYSYAITHGTPQIQSLARYKLGWTHFKQQRYAAAVEQFVNMLRGLHEDTIRAGNVELDLRKEACTYIAASLSYVDFQGPGPDEPYIPREDILDTEKDPRKAEQIMRVGIERVRYGKIIPQDEPFTSDIYAALADEYRELSQPHNMIEVGELFLAKWPTHARAGEMRTKIAEAKSRIMSP